MYIIIIYLAIYGFIISNVFIEISRGRYLINLLLKGHLEVIGGIVVIKGQIPCYLRSNLDTYYIIITYLFNKNFN